MAGQSLTYTATVSPIPDGGTVSFSDGGSGIAACASQAVSTTGPSAGTATCTTTFTSSGNHAITAAYSGDTNYAGSTTSSALTQVVNKAATGTALISSRNPSQAGQSVTFTAGITVVSPGAGSPTGTVEFKSDGTDISGCSAQVLNTTTEQASCTTSSLSVSSGHHIAALYSGDSNFARSTTAPLTQVVTSLSATTTSLSSSVEPSVVNQQVTYTATIAPVPNGGTVAFNDGGTSISGCSSQAVSTSSGKATCVVTYTSTGSHSIKAVYSGDSAYKTSTSSALAQYVDTDLSGYPKSNGVYNLCSANLTSAYLAGENLAGANICNAHLAGVTLLNAILTTVNLTGTTLKNGNLTGVNLSGATMTRAILTGANLTNANLQGATGLTAAALSGVTWKNTTCPDGTNSTNDSGTCVNNLGSAVT